MITRTLDEMINDTRDKVVVDVRTEADFRQDSWPGAVNIPLETFDAEKETLQREKPLYLLCYNGRRSDALARALSEEGFEAYNIDRGYYALVKRRLDLQDAADEAVREKRLRDIEHHLIKRYRRELWTKFTRAINEYELIRDGDKIAVCVSGGKVSTLMAKLFQELLRHGKKNFEAVFLVMDPGYNEINMRVIRENARLLDIPVTVFTSDIYDIVAGEAARKKNGTNSPCYLCARMRRGALYAHARELGCNKIALGHHYDDVIETILMGMLYGGQIQTMMPKLHSTNFPGMELIRPMYLVREDDIKRWRDSEALHFIRCACRLTESCDITGDPLPDAVGHKRTEIKQLIARLKERSPYIESNIFRSVENVHLGALVAWKDRDGARRHFLDDYDETHTEDRVSPHTDMEGNGDA